MIDPSLVCLGSPLSGLKKSFDIGCFLLEVFAKSGFDPKIGIGALAAMEE